jgi:CMP-N-acetylneuraminic acid synthetase
MGDGAMKEILGIIPARGGSKGVPKKNIKLLGGEPLIAWTIEEAKKSKMLNRLILSTDSEEITEIGRKYSVEVPFLRPAELAKDDTPTIDVIKHCLGYLKKTENYIPDVVVILQPTTPFRKSKDIDEAINLYLQRNVSAVVSVSKVPSHYNPEWQLVIDSNGMLTTRDGKKLSALKTRRQRLMDTYYRNGEIYVINPDNIIDKNNVYGDTVLPFITRGKVNIDSIIDFEYAEFLIKREQIDT